MFEVSCSIWFCSILLFHHKYFAPLLGIIIATFQTKSGQIFWRYARGSPLDENAIVCWKFCHVLHKLLRDAYPRIIYDSYKYKGTLLDLGKMWGLLKQGYGRLIQNYCSLLVNKMEFHMRVRLFRGIYFESSLMVLFCRIPNFQEI